MNVERVTVSLPAEQAGQLRRAVESGGAASVSAYVSAALDDRLSRDRALAELESLMGGPPPRDALAWAYRALGVDDGHADAGDSRAS
ncbi:MAG: ribbon-helix-helix domain-containing protein [Carbonactinosporaceae bacterium]